MATKPHAAKARRAKTELLRPLTQEWAAETHKRT